MRPAPSRHGAGGGGVGGQTTPTPTGQATGFGRTCVSEGMGWDDPRLGDVVHCGACGLAYPERAVASSRKGPYWRMPTSGRAVDSSPRNAREIGGDRNARSDGAVVACESVQFSGPNRDLGSTRRFLGFESLPSGMVVLSSEKILWMIVEVIF